MEFFLQIDNILPIVYNNNMVYYAPNINQSTFGIDQMELLSLIRSRVGQNLEYLFIVPQIYSKIHCELGFGG